MVKIIKVGEIKIKASDATDKKGRKGYFIAESELNSSAVKIIKKASRSKSARKVQAKKTAVRHEVKEVLKELSDYNSGKLKLRSFDEFFKKI